MVALDPGVNAIGRRRRDGSPWLPPSNGAPRPLNSGPEAFAAFTRAYEQAAQEADQYEGPEDDSDEGPDHAMRAADALTGALLERFRGRDAAAVADGNSFRHIAAEELGCDMDA
ncbi:SUKH-4 family immunity protein [Actinacidiphila sp. bgisy160]|uniref:SUKH-4 family immunity protein n=1 Tax=Actinacidiphila sp. bgisy160 TaxID=3413796 RepID=UPI003D742D67